MYDLGLVLQRPSESDLPTLVDSFTLDGHGACIVKVCGRGVIADPGRFGRLNFRVARKSRSRVFVYQLIPADEVRLDGHWTME